MNRYFALIVLVLGLVITAAATQYMQSSVEKISEQEFTAQCNEIQNETSARLYEHARILRSGAAFINASDTVTREKWRIYTKLQKIEQQLPGIQGIGFSLLIQPGELPRHIQEIRREGFPEYTVRPVGDRELYSSIIYLEPFSDRNLRAFGYDMLSEPVRRAAMELARDTNEATLSSKVVLVQETENDVQAGTLMYVAVYRKSMPIETVEQRRAALFGWVYSPYRMNDLMQGILGTSFPGKEKRLHLQIFDGEQPSSVSFLYSSHATEDVKLFSAAHYSKQVPVDFNGKRWTLRFTQTGSGFFSVEYIPIWLTLASGILITILLFALMRTQQNSRVEALRMVEARTEELRTEKRRLASIIDGTKTGTWEWNVQTGETVFNERWAEIIGYALDEISPVSIETWMKFAHPDDLQKSDELLEKHFKRELDYYEYESRMKHKNGRWVWVLDRGKVASWSDDGKPLWMYGTHQDITERKQDQETLLNREEIFSLFMKHSPFYTYIKVVTSTESRVLQASDNFQQMIGIPGSEMIGKTMSELFPAEMAAKINADDWSVVSNGDVLEFEEDFNGRNYNSIKFPIVQRDRTFLAGYTIDVSERKKAEEEKRALEQQLQQTQKMESLGVLAGGIAHDFNNILAVIICNCSLAIQRPQMAGELILEIETAAQRAAGLCRQMLAYAGKTQFVQSNLDVTALLDDMLGILKSTLPQNVNIKPCITGNIPYIKADAGQISQIIMNMIINASEAIGEEQGDIRVALTKAAITAEQAEKDYTGKAITPGQYICLEVTDTGCGMDYETRRRIFEPFYTTKFVGRGLGMPAALGVITSHKGALQLTSQPGRGTTFKVYLPAQFSDSAPEPPEQITQSEWKGSGTIMLVEDEPQLMTVARKLLETLGFSVIEATNGIEALEQYNKNAADIRLVVTDIGMPLMNGYQLTAELKILAPTVPVIISSGFSEDDVTSKIPPGDIAGMICKPYNFDQIRKVLRGVVEG
jgi:PAS domain S-box-containing protein